MKRACLIASTLFLAGCSCGLTSNALEYSAVSDTNVYRIAKTRKGMTEKQVLCIMHKPYCYETFEFDGDVYDVWFYVTRPTGLDQSRMVPQNLTPLTFKNGILVGSGYYWYYFAMKEQQKEWEAKNPPAPKPKTQAEEDAEFQKELREPGKKAKTIDEAIKEAGTEKTTSLAPEKIETLVAAKAKPAVKEAPVAKVKPSQWTPSPIGSIQKQKLSEVQIGMTEAEVTSLIGPPTDYQTYQINNDLYEVWLYDVIASLGTGHSVPLIFKNSVLMSMSNKDYNAIKTKASQKRINGYDRNDQRMEEDASEQNFDFW